jgi:hypothetical protein
MHYDTTDFTLEEISKFQHQLEEGYDVPDARYEHWLQLIVRREEVLDPSLDSLASG